MRLALTFTLIFGAVAWPAQSQSRSSITADDSLARDSLLLRLLVIQVRDASSKRGVAHPMLCIREDSSGLGYTIGESDGRLMIGGALPTGTLHLRVLAPAYEPRELTVRWPEQRGRVVLVALHSKRGKPQDPECNRS